VPNKIEMRATVTMDSIVVAGNDQVTTDLDGETNGLQMANGIYYNLNRWEPVWKLFRSRERSGGFTRNLSNTLFSPRFASEICLLSCGNSRKRNWSL
jgi:hypothetical protein